MLRVSVLLGCLGVLALSCGHSEPTIAYRYAVRGSGDDVTITFLTEQLGSVQRTVDLPWTSEEFLGTGDSPVRIEAAGPPGSRVKCVVRSRPVTGLYGGNGSGESSATEEDRTRCALDQGAFNNILPDA
jgi:hypothetical protein